MASYRFSLTVILITIPSRMNRFLVPMVEEIDRQCKGRNDVEFLCLMDNQTMTLGAKWNVLIGAARGEYIVTVDDDDSISADYIDRICCAVRECGGSDAIVFDTEMFHDGKFSARVHWSIDNDPRDDWEAGEIWRYPSQFMPVRADIRKRHPFPNIWRGSDWKQAQRMRHELETEYVIRDDDGEVAVLYRYLSRSENTEHKDKHEEERLRRTS